MSDRQEVMAKKEYIEISKSFFIDADFELQFKKLGLTSIETIFSFNTAKNLAKKNLARFRSRLQFEVKLPDSSRSKTLFLKRYDGPPIWIQLKNWLTAHGRKSCGSVEFETAQQLQESGIKTPGTVAYGTEWATFFEKRSFFITEKIPDADALERKLPDYFDGIDSVQNLKLRRKFITQLAAFIRKFHKTDFRHRDLYFSHIFHSENGSFYLIDLARAFRPVILARRYQIKDLAQMYYSAPGQYFSRTDRLRFFLNYTGRHKLTMTDKAFIRKVLKKVKLMARHNKKHGRQPPFAGEKMEVQIQ